MSSPMPIGTDTVTGANTSAVNASSIAEAFVANTRQNSGSDDTRVRTGQASHDR